MIDHRVEDGVGRIHLNDPGSRNAFTADVAQALVAAVSAVAAEAGAVVLTAEPPVFCSGGNLDDLIEPKAPLSVIYEGFDALRRCPVPTIAVVDGPAIGAGVNLPLACDVVVAGPGARFDPRFLDVGIHPGGGHLHGLRQRVGRQGAAALSLCGDALTGEEAAAVGLAWRYAEDPLALALRFARRAAGRDRELVVRTKQTLDTDSDDPVAVEAEAQAWSMARPGFADGVRRIKESLAQRRDR
jgi:enoyl-CoA hydratase